MWVRSAPLKFHLLIHIHSNRRQICKIHVLRSPTYSRHRFVWASSDATKLFDHRAINMPQYKNGHASRRYCCIRNHAMLIVRDITIVCGTCTRKIERYDESIAISLFFFSLTFVPAIQLQIVIRQVTMDIGLVRRGIIKRMSVPFLFLSAWCISLSENVIARNARAFACS